MSQSSDPILDLATIQHHLERHYVDVLELARHERKAERSTDLYATGKLLHSVIELVGLARECYCPFDAE